RRANPAIRSTARRVASESAPPYRLIGRPRTARPPPRSPARVGGGAGMQNRKFVWVCDLRNIDRVEGPRSRWALARESRKGDVGMATQPRFEGQPAQPIGPRPGAMPGAEALQLTGAQWGPVLAGAFAAIAALLILLTLGGAVGATIGASPSPAQGIGVGAGIWGAIVVIVSYLFAG